MWTILKVSVEFVATLLLFYVRGFFCLFVWFFCQWGTWNLSFPTRIELTPLHWQWSLNLQDLTWSPLLFCCLNFKILSYWIRTSRTVFSNGDITLPSVFGFNMTFCWIFQEKVSRWFWHEIRILFGGIKIKKKTFFFYIGMHDRFHLKNWFCFIKYLFGFWFSFWILMVFPSACWYEM